jgi:hypothetical protein
MMRELQKQGARKEKELAKFANGRRQRDENGL